MVCIAYYTEFNVQICNYAQKQCICHGNIEHATDENLFGNYCCRWTAANFCHPVQRCRQQIGGESDILEGDESQFGKCKYSRGSRKNRRRTWVFGMISRTTKRLFLYVCPQDASGMYKRTSRALIPMILANVKPGTMLYTDGWRVGTFDDYSDKS